MSVVAPEFNGQQWSTPGNPTIMLRNDDRTAYVLPWSVLGIVGDDGAAITAAFKLFPKSADGFNVGRVRLGPYVYNIASTAQVPNPGGHLELAAGTVLAVQGTAGTGVSMIGPAGAAAPTAYPTLTQAGRITGPGIIDGTVAGANAIGLDFGNMEANEVTGLRVANFAGSGSIGIHETCNKSAAHTEKSRISVGLYNNTVGYQFDAPSPGQNSHFYSNWDIQMEAFPGQTGIQFANAAGIRGGLMRTMGNFYTTAVGGPAGVGIDFSNGTTSHFDTGVLVLSWETTGGGSNTFQTIKFGGNSNAGIHNCVGSILFADSGWTNSDVGAGQFQFGGYINNQDPTLVANNTAPNGWPGTTGAAPVSNAPGAFNTTATTTANFMAGLNQTITPTNTGLIQVIINGVGFTATGAVPFTIGARHGTGTPPVANAADTGARINGTGDPTFQAAAVSEGTSFVFSGVIGPVTIGQTAWVDLGLNTSNASDQATIKNLQVVLIEI